MKKREERKKALQKLKEQELAKLKEKISYNIDKSIN